MENINLKIYDGKGLILGRLAAAAAKSALLGDEVKVINCEKVVISGRKTYVFARNKQRLDRKGYPLKSARLSRLPERYVRRSIRGMLPWKHSRGKEAFRRVMCYRGVPEELAGKENITIEKAAAKKLPTLYFTTVEEICRSAGGKL